ncbi:putative sorting protein [Gonapodya prolifera JEL478]|uniref:Putative sorting protein n=1 Tax=Gonapodya prolifera (strain JEL478) TaxID=1344416 RepID=A0A139A8P6_GONPJ|nr:putative sorting protein [Gonapodya prolifera JEL478]|eukprot:KXS13084.1 putative sorting protein [Gonapodya prolifera JEL478]
MNANLIEKVNKLQDLFAKVGVQNTGIDLPQIVVVGSQSSGKSSILENIVGKDFLPRGAGIVTRRPLVLQLINRNPQTSRAPSISRTSGETPVITEPTEWGEFLHIPNKKFTNFDDIRDEIVRDTASKAGTNGGISKDPINLRIYSPNVLTLTLVDLPGLTKVPVGDQPKDIEHMVREMILGYIKVPNAIILAVTAANTDLANSDSLKLAGEVDKDGLRTIGVLTKIDLMDPGTNVVDILAGRVISLQLGYVPVVNRGQRDIESQKKITKALDDEKAFFGQHPVYQSMSQVCGTPFLAKKLSMILTGHIRKSLPDMRAKLSSKLLEYRRELDSLGNDVTDESSQAYVMLSLIKKFSDEFFQVLDGSFPDLDPSVVSGGARISVVFKNNFSPVITGMNVSLDKERTRVEILNSSGKEPKLFPSNAPFLKLIKDQIMRLEEPSLKCVDIVHQELSTIIKLLLNRYKVFNRFPQLKEFFHVVVTNHVQKAVKPTKKLVRDIINAEATFINFAHPKSVGVDDAIAVVQKNRMGTGTRDPAPPTPRKFMSITRYLETLLNKVKSAGGVLEPPPEMLKPISGLSEEDRFDSEVIELLVKTQFNIAKDTVANLIPKAIILRLVNATMESLYTELHSKLFKTEVMGRLLKENETSAERREMCNKMIAALTKADEILTETVGNIETAKL